MKWMIAAVGLVALSLSGCGQQAAPRESDAQQATQAERYVFEVSQDVAGVYVPASDYALRNWRLKQVSLGHADAFAAWDATGRAASAAPVKLVFEDRQDTNAETGQPRTLTLIPAAFDLRDDKVVIEAVSGGLGEVRFDGALDGQAEAAALKGQLKIGTQIFENTELKLKTGG
ncbi:hypothetical protein [Brevundimonas sp.]|uniref:hypothetical protein n=1 Tax=Brevundimonas sp. TaxID=1871086 RepID=UPI00289C88B5|nr:hypothetical protein [Brevundimonas sp.]